MVELNNNTDPPSLPPEVVDYATFREKGIALLQKLSGREWTDHNTHDPGITLLEQLCYALTDLSYRINFPIPDLMAEGLGANLPAHFRPAGMLSSGPVTLLDWRKVLLDTEGVHNAWIYLLDTASEQYDSQVYYDPVEEALRMSLPIVNRDSEQSIAPIEIRGLYRVAFIPEPGQNPANVKNKLRSRLLERRNLCEDFHLIEALASQAVQVKAVVEVGAVSDPAHLLASIYFVIQAYLSPSIRFYTLQERLEAGYSLEGLLEGPVLDHGFLDDQELEDFQMRRSVRISDLIRLIMEIEGVAAIHQLRISLPGSTQVASTEEGEAWELILPDGKAPVLIVPGPSAALAPGEGVALSKKGLPVHVSWATTLEKLDQLKRAENERAKPQRQETGQLAFRPGRQRQAALHQSIQHQFPEIYGVGEVGLPWPASPQRVAQARQFKAYLALFDQLLANAFAQLEGAGKLFSLKAGASEKVYFSQSMRNEIPGFESLIRWEAFGLTARDPKFKQAIVYQERIQEWTESVVNEERVPEWTEEKDKDIVKENLWERRNRLLNHLLARFGEQLDEHDASLKKQLFAHKETLLNNYPQLSRERGKAFNYTKPIASAGPDEPITGPLRSNVSGLERRLALLLGFPPVQPVSLAGLSENAPGGFHLVEHILLRPSVSDKKQQSPIMELPVGADGSRPPLKDPFSLQLSFMFPAWLYRFEEVKNPGFRKVVAKTLREETPAHLRIFVHWLSREEMVAFEEAYLQWIEPLQTP